MTTMMERHPLTPVAPPVLIQDFYSDDEIATIVDVIRKNSPWRLVLAHHFSSTEEYLAVSGGKNRKADAKLSDFVAPVFRGFFGNDGVVYHPELNDIYFGRKLLDTARKLHGARYGMAHDMFFNVSGPSHSFDAGHFDSGSFRGIGLHNSPIWLIGIMTKSGLFEDWAVKTAQVLTYFYQSDQGGGMTCWPDGPDRAPTRQAAPFWNSAFLTDNSRMYHRREGNGPIDRRDYPDLDLQSTLHSVDDDRWSIRNGDKEISQFGSADARMLIHYTALLFDDLAEVKRFQDHTDDLTSDRVFEMLVSDLRSKGINVVEPADPLTDTTFIAQLTHHYQMSPNEYPADAPLDVH